MTVDTVPAGTTPQQLCTLLADAYERGDLTWLKARWFEDIRGREVLRSAINEGFISKSEVVGGCLGGGCFLLALGDDTYMEAIKLIAHFLWQADPDVYCSDFADEDWEDFVTGYNDRDQRVEEEVIKLLRDASTHGIVIESDDPDGR